MMKYLITGGCGFLGSHLAAEAMRRGGDVLVFDNLCRIGSSRNLEWLRTLGEVGFIHGDVRSSYDVERIVKEFKPNVVFHVAGQVAMTKSLQNPRYDFEVNALGTLNVLEAIRVHAPDAVLVFSSTNKVYGDLAHIRYEELETRYVCPDYPRGFDESLPLAFHSPYGCSKGAADQYVLDYNRMFGLKTVVFRHSTVYGERQFATYDQGWVGWFCQQAIRSKQKAVGTPFTITGTGKQVRDVLHVRDAVSCYFRAIEHVDVVRGHAFNIGGGIENSLSLLELFALLEQVLDTKLSWIHLAERASDQKVFVADIKKANEMLGWRPTISKEDGVQDMVLWSKHVALRGDLI